MAGAGGRANVAGGTAENGWRVGRLQEDLGTDSESEESEEASGSEQEEPSWISWFCGLKGNEFFCEVEEDYIADDFNLSGLSSQVPYYEYALDMVLDNDPPTDVVLTDEQHELLESAAEMLYGLVHARYIVTQRGLSAMLEKYKNCDFGRCPRVLCEGQPCLPVGTSDLPSMSTAKIFCPKCEDIFYPRNEYQCSIDGAYFGTTFPHLLFMTFPAYRPPRCKDQYVPRVFGFKLHPTAYGNRRQLRGAEEEAAAQQQQGGGGAQQQQGQQQRGEGPSRADGPIDKAQASAPQPTNGRA